MKTKWLLLFCITTLFAEQKSVSPEVIEKQIEDAEAEFDRAKKMFNPWYTGPLLTPSAHILTPGLINLQPYLFVTQNYGRFDQHGHSHRIPHLNQLNFPLIILAGIIDWFDASLTVQGFKNQSQGHSSVNWGDTSFSLGFGLLSEGPYRPAVLLSVKESFPSGAYQHLKHVVDSTGSGAYQTTLGLNLSKVLWWFTFHPMATRFAFSWSLPAMVHVEGLNSYGGGHGTDGKVRVGNGVSIDFGYEFSFTQAWVAALDIVYTYSQKTTFSGHSAGNPVGGPFSDQLSLAPALEYNLNENFGFIGGTWFSVWGRNSLNFVSAVASFTATF